MAIITLLIVLLSLLCSSTVVAQSCVVVANANKVIDVLTAYDIERIFLGKMKRWPDGQAITVVFNNEKSVQATFSRQHLHRSWRQVSTYWRKKLYSGHSMLPVFVDDDVQVREYLLSHPEAISYVSLASVDVSITVIEVQP